MVRLYKNYKTSSFILNTLQFFLNGKSFPGVLKLHYSMRSFPQSYLRNSNSHYHLFLVVPLVDHCLHYHLLFSTKVIGFSSCSVIGYFGIRYWFLFLVLFKLKRDHFPFWYEILSFYIVIICCLSKMMMGLSNKIFFQNSEVWTNICILK